MRFVPLEELGIEYEDCWKDNPVELFKRMNKVGDDLVRRLNEPDSMGELTRKFKEKAASNDAAVERAKELLDQINNLILGEDAEVVANLRSMLSKTEALADSIVVTMGIRANSEELPKSLLHKMYVNLREFQKMYLKLGDPMLGLVKNTDQIEPHDILPAKSGNYTPKKSSSKIYTYWVDDQNYANPYTVAKLLGIYEEGMMYLEIQNTILHGDFPNVQMEEI